MGLCIATIKLGALTEAHLIKIWRSRLKIKLAFELLHDDNPADVDFVLEGYFHPGSRGIRAGRNGPAGINCIIEHPRALARVVRG